MGINNMYKKLFLMVFCLLLFNEAIFSDEINFIAEIQGVTVNGGIVYGAIYSNANNYRNHQHDFTFQGNSINSVLQFNLQIPAGEYVIEVYQDSNNNGQLDFGLFNIPREPVGITNYSGRGIPGNFNREKVTINNGTRIIIQMFKI
jgi:uncharacterized protein (DUF2141 family)